MFMFWPSNQITGFDKIALKLYDVNWDFIIKKSDNGKNRSYKEKKYEIKKKQRYILEIEKNENIRQVSKPKFNLKIVQ